MILIKQELVYASLAPKYLTLLFLFSFLDPFAHSLETHIILLTPKKGLPMISILSHVKPFMTDATWGTDLRYKDHGSFCIFR